MSDESSKVLPFSIPPIIGYQMHAFPLTVVLDNEECLPWFYSNYIQLFCKEQFTGTFFDFFNLNTGEWLNFCYPGSPHVIYNAVDPVVLYTGGVNVTEFLMNYIDRGYYICIFLDEFHIPGKRPYQKSRFNHDSLIFGYDSKEGYFHTAGFDNTGAYTRSILSFEDFEKAHLSSDIETCLIVLFKKNTDIKYEFDLKLVTEMLEDYVKSRNSSERLRMLRNPEKDIVYGIGIYKQLIKYIEVLAETDIEFDHIKPFHILWEHKKCMLLRLKYIEEKCKITSIAEYYSSYEKI
ncbi:MAG: hypothetical protein Q8936_24925, partial [Bacillota bacterium]|nr:hypothetical protein [Bacillota bacterium]